MRYLLLIEVLNMNKKSELFYHSMGNIFDVLGGAIQTSNDLRFFESKEIDVLVKFIGNRLPDDPVSGISKNQFMTLCDILEIDDDDLEIDGINPKCPTAPDVFKTIYAHYNQIYLLPFIYRLIRQILYDMNSEIELIAEDKNWLKVFLENQKIDRPASWVDLL